MTSSSMALQSRVMSICSMALQSRVISICSMVLQSRVISICSMVLQNRVVLYAIPAEFTRFWSAMLRGIESTKTSQEHGHADLRL